MADLRQSSPRRTIPTNRFKDRSDPDRGDAPKSPSSHYRHQSTKQSASSTLLRILTLSAVWTSGFFMAKIFSNENPINNVSRHLSDELMLTSTKANLIPLLRRPSCQDDENQDSKAKLSTWTTTDGLAYQPGVPMNVQQRQTSLHPKWKLWGEMTPSQQQAALKETNHYLNKYGKLITSKKGPRAKQTIQHGTCELTNVGREGNHQLCGPVLNGNCTFLSFGINDDPSFDQDLGERWQCRGFAGDPTVQHPSKLHDLVTFHSVGANMLMANEERLKNKGGSADWWEVSFPSVRKFLKLNHINILKIDCEGCEIAWARDIIAEDPGFLFAIDQISVETHVTRTWMDTDEHVYYFGMLFALLEEAGFVMEWSSIFGCSKRHEDAGCMPSILDTDFPCGHKPWPGKTTVVLGFSCQDFLFRRDPSKALFQ
ncbi:methyltransferase domain containing protein [Nitzschia inconspicua]|uniref:Methyltransferase domain containing protein n=1 Tax=Nitzschia inconspicua TaxID=303405 RepID=A0A9K3LXG6_9STRA|nr:methyltransferase domain containing protein [Nitzschia inconspicua]